MRKTRSPGNSWWKCWLLLEFSGVKVDSLGVSLTFLEDVWICQVHHGGTTTPGVP